MLFGYFFAIINILLEKIYCNLDPIGHLAKEGNWFKTEEKDNFDLFPFAFLK